MSLFTHGSDDARRAEYGGGNTCGSKIVYPTPFGRLRAARRIAKSAEVSLGDGEARHFRLRSAPAVEDVFDSRRSSVRIETGRSLRL